jgi:hypothetical protein
MALTGQARADIIFNDSNFNGHSSRSGADDPVTFITNVAQNTAITNIGILNDLATAGDVRFLIYDINTASLVYLSSPKAFGADSGSDTWKVSDAFSFTLLAGHQYYIGGVANVSNLAAFQFPPINHTENGITSDGSNGNFTFNGGIEGNGGAGIPLRLYANAAVPEPTSLALFGLGTLGLAGWRLRRRHAGRERAGTSVSAQSGVGTGVHGAALLSFCITQARACRIATPTTAPQSSRHPIAHQPRA